MKTKLKSISAMLGLLFFIGATVAFVPFGQESFACGSCMGGMGNMGNMPQQRNPGGSNQTVIITREKAIEIVTNYIKQQSSEMRIGNVTDAGPVYEAEIISLDDEILQVIGVHKQSGQLVTIN